jgi:glycosyltransferase involved in cell wall biosynthesis
MLTVIMPTHNGADTLQRTLDAFCQLETPPGGWLLVIVDNASSDDTRNIIGRYQDRLPLLCVSEPRLGKSLALNTGIAQARGDFVVFADDDVLPVPEWLAEWRRVADQYPELGLFGGAIEPDFEAAPPRWLDRTDWATELYTATLRNPPEGPITTEGLDVYGPNMAIRADVLAKGPRFDARLMIGPASMGGSDSEFVRRIAAMGIKPGFAPTARVRHIVQRHQVARLWMLRRFYRYGHTYHYFDRLDHPIAGATIAGIPRYMFRRVATRALRLPFVLLTFDEFRIISHLRLLAYDLGAMHQARVMARHP